MPAKRPHALLLSSDSSTPPRPTKRVKDIPSDSPSNPFGLQRRSSFEAGKLPPAISFSKHIALRFTLFNPDLDADGATTPCFRVVQVPTNYTFQHLGTLVEFVFNLDTALEIDELANGSDDSEAEALRLRASAGRTWEVLKDATPVEKGRTAGRIRGGKPWARVSLRRPRSIRPYGSSSGIETSDDLAGMECRLAREDEFTIGDAWPRGHELKRAVILEREVPERWTVHITPNTSKIPARRGMGNKPFVFRGAGRGRPNRRVKSAPKGAVDVDPYNLPDAFETYLRLAATSAEHDDPFSYCEVSEDEEDTLARIDAAHGWMLRVTREGMATFDKELKAEAEADAEAKAASKTRRPAPKGREIMEAFETDELDPLDNDDPFGDEPEI